MIEILTLYAFGILSQTLAPADSIIDITLYKTIEGIHFAPIGASHIKIWNPELFKFQDMAYEISTIIYTV